MQQSNGVESGLRARLLLRDFVQLGAGGEPDSLVGGDGDQFAGPASPNGLDPSGLDLSHRERPEPGKHDAVAAGESVLNAPKDRVQGGFALRP